MRTVKAYDLREWDEILISQKQRKARIIKKVLHVTVKGAKKVLLIQPNCAQLCLDPEQDVFLTSRIGDVSKLILAGDLN